MQVKISPQPAVDLAQQIISFVDIHKDSDIFCFTAGGSALEIFSYLQLNQSQKRRTIFCMGDERVSGESSISNYLQLADSLGPNHEFNVIDTRALHAETASNYARRIKKNILAKINSLENPKIISIQGVGHDGHTAGIFPMHIASFRDTYRADSTYVPVSGRGLTIDSRASLTPQFILECVDQVLGYAKSEYKCDHILSELIKRDYELHEMPAQIIKIHKNSYLFTDCEKLTQH